MSLGWLDIHTHFSLPHKNDEQRKTSFKQMHQLCFLMPEEWSWNTDDSIAYMNKAGVQMSMLSYIPRTLEALQAANDYAANKVKEHPTRFGLLCGLPTDNPTACLAEIERGRTELMADGFAVSAIRKGVGLGDSSLEPVWQKLEALHATVFCHPNPASPPNDGRPSPLLEVAFETCRVIVDMVYKRIFQRYPNIKFVFAHGGGVLPSLSGRLELLGAEPWVPNPNRLTRQDIHNQLASIYVDTAASAATGMRPAVQMVGQDHVIYGADCGVPCSSHETMENNRIAVLEVEKEMGIPSGHVGQNGWKLFPSAAQRVMKGRSTEVSTGEVEGVSKQIASAEK